MNLDGICIAARVAIVCVVFAFFVFIPLKSRYRYDNRMTCLWVSALVFITVAVTILFFVPGQFLNHYGVFGILLWICLAVVVFCITLKGSFLELLFTVLVVLNLYVDIMVIARVIVCTVAIRMPETLAESLISTSILLVFTPFLYILFMRFYKPVIELDIRLPFWRVIWIIPALTYLVFYVKFINDYWRFPVDMNGGDVLFCVLWSFTTYILFVVTLSMLLQAYKGIVAAQQTRHMAAQLQMQEALYEQMMEKIRTNTRLRHDWRHHLMIINGFAEVGNVDNLRLYMQQLMPEYVSESDAPLCENHTVDILLRYYRSMALELGISMEINAQIPDKLRIADPDIGIVFGNLLENAMHACKSQKSGKRKIYVRAFMKESQLVLMMENTYDHAIAEKNGSFMSTKHEGEGRGLSSVRNVVQKYHGIIRVEYEQNLFKVQLFLNRS